MGQCALLKGQCLLTATAAWVLTQTQGMVEMVRWRLREPQRRHALVQRGGVKMASVLGQGTCRPRHLPEHNWALWPRARGSGGEELGQEGSTEDQVVGDTATCSGTFTKPRMAREAAGFSA